MQSNEIKLSANEIDTIIKNSGTLTLIMDKLNKLAIIRRLEVEYNGDFDEAEYLYSSIGNELGIMLHNRPSFINEMNLFKDIYDRYIDSIKIPPKE